MAKVTIVRTDKITSVDPGNDSGRDTLVTYTTEGGRLDVVMVTGAAPTDDAIAAAIKQHEQAKAARAGKQFDI